MPPELTILYPGSVLILAIILFGVSHASARKDSSGAVLMFKRITTWWLGISIGVFFTGCAYLVIYFNEDFFLSFT